MSVRRLASDEVQPPAFAFSNDNEAWARSKIAEYPAGRQQSAVIPLLWRAQEQEGWVTRAAIESIATMLGMPYIRVLEVATFYTQFLLKPVGSRAHVLVCGTTPCMLRGAEDLRHVCEHRINPEPFALNDAGTLSWEEVECLGACVNAPMVMIGNDTYEDLTVDSFGALLDTFERGEGASVTPGPQITRQFSAAEGGATTLREAPSAEREKFVPPLPPAEDAPAAPAAPAAAAPAAKPATAPAAEKPAPEQEPTKPGRKREVAEEAAPALKGPPRSRKASAAQTKAEADQIDAPQDGEPSRAMRPDAVGAEQEGGKRDDGASVKADRADEPLFAAPEGKKDDLKLITGVGPKLEATMNGLGVTTWAQVAAFSDEDIARVEDRLNFKGRIRRDNWIAQAKALAGGGVEEYRRVFGKDPK